MKIVIAGGSGFLGRALSGRLVADGHQVLALTRAGGQSRPWETARSSVSWVPNATAGDWASALDGADAVVNLAGASIGDARWTTARKTAILDSRVDATRSLVAAIAELRQPSVRVRQLVGARLLRRPRRRGTGRGCGRRPGFPRRCLRPLGSRGAGGLGEVPRRDAADRHRAGSRRRRAARMVLPFKLGAGGPFGSGASSCRGFTWTIGWASRCSRSPIRRWYGPVNLGSPRPCATVSSLRRWGAACTGPA